MPEIVSLKKAEKCRETELNRRRKDFQSFALPTELSRHLRLVVNISKAKFQNQSSAPRSHGVHGDSRSNIFFSVSLCVLRGSVVEYWCNKIGDKKNRAPDFSEALVRPIKRGLIYKIGSAFLSVKEN